MDFKEIAKNAAKNVADGYLKKIKLYAEIAAGVIVGFLLLMSTIGGGNQDVNAETTSNADGMNYISSSSWNDFLKYLHMAEGGGQVYKNSEDVDCYKVTNGAVGYGVDIATHKATLTALGYEISEGALIPIVDVDQIEKSVVEARYNDIKNLASSNGIDLTQYQIFALISRTYNYGFAGGTGQATSSFIYPSTLTFVEAYKQYYANINNDDFYGDYTKTDFNNGLYTQYMTYLKYLNGTYPEGWVTRRQSEWCLFQTGYYGWGLKNGTYPAGFDSYCAKSNGFRADLYNSDGTVNEESIQELEYALESEHNILIPSGKGFNNWKDIPEGDTDNPIRRAVKGEFHGFSGSVAEGTPRGNNGLSTYQCTWWANGRASEYLKQYGTVYKSYPTNSGNGGEYYIINKNNGYFNYGSEPKANSLLSTASSSGYGHVLYIEAVDNVNKYYYASEAGSGYQWGGICKYEFGHHSCTGNYGFIYLDEPIKK